MAETYLVGLDIGTSGIRGTAYDTNGRIVLHNESSINTHSTEEWERALRDTALYLPDGELLCTADGTSGTAVCVDAFGEPVFPPEMYFESAPEYAEEVLDHEEAAGVAERGGAVSATSPLPKLLRLRDEYPAAFEEVEWVLSPTTWLLYRLAYPDGERWTNIATDWTNALKFCADIVSNPPTWYDPLFEAVSLPTELFPRIVAPGTNVGSAASDLAAEIGLDGAEIYQGMTDGNASAMSARCLEPGDYSIACESTSVVKYVSESVVPHEALYYHRHPIEGYLAGAAFESGVVLEWICERLLDIDQHRGVELARAVNPEEEYELFLQGNRSPYFESGMANSVYGFWPDDNLTTAEARGRLVRGIMSGIALAEYSYLPLIEDHFQAGINRVSLVGGGVAGNTETFGWWNRLRASIWDRPVVQMEPRTTVGSLIPATLTAGVFDDVESAAESLLESHGTIQPDDRLSAAYAQRRRTHADRWQAVHEHYRRWSKYDSHTS